MSSQKFFLDYNSIDGRWKILDQDNFPFADCDNADDTIAHFRAMGHKDPIYANSMFTGIIDEVVE